MKYFFHFILFIFIHFNATAQWHDTKNESMLLSRNSYTPVHSIDSITGVIINNNDTLYFSNYNSSYQYTWCYLMDSIIIYQGYPFIPSSYGVYILVVTDSATANSFVTLPYNFGGGCSVAIQSNQPLCYESCDGSAQAIVVGNGPVSYLWSTGDTTSSVQNLCSGLYGIAITDSSGCISVDTFNIASPDKLRLTNATLTDLSCFQSCDGSVYPIIEGGTLPYRYSWSNGDTTQNIDWVCSDLYYLTVHDLYDCFLIDTFDVKQPLPLVLNANFSNTTCSGCSDGYIALQMTGGTQPYIVTLFPSMGNISNDTIYNLPQGVYDIMLSDSNGCFAELLDTIFDAPNGIINLNEMHWSVFYDETNYSIRLNNVNQFIKCFSVFDVSGKMVFRKENISDDLISDFALSPALYLYQIILPDGILNGKLLVK